MPLSPLTSRLRRLWTHDIWAAGLIRDRSLKSRCFALLRVVSITISGLHEIHVAIRAAALSYSSLLALGPLVAIAVLISGFALGNRDPALVAQSMNRVISFIAPQVAQYDKADEADRARAAKTAPSPGNAAEHAVPGTIAPAQAGGRSPGFQQESTGHTGRPATGPATAGPAADTPAPAPEMVQLLNNFITSSRSGTAGIIGILTLFIIVIGLFTTIENTFNDIWGVRRGRSLLARIVYYWSVITLGALLFFTSLTLLSAGAFMNVFFEKIPLGAQLKEFFTWMLPSGSVLLLVAILTLFYRLVPHTRVRWRAALLGAVIVTVLLFLNNYLAFLYFKRVVLSKSLYGSVSIMPVLMIGLYIFWFFVLVGGQITYAVQNVRYRSSQTAWHSLNHESMSLVVLLLIARRFKVAAPAYAVSELAALIRVPSQILNESLNRLSDIKLITELPPAEGADPNDLRYQPARPLDQITLDEFRREFENYGEAPTAGLLDVVDPVLAYYHERLAKVLPGALADKTLDQLIEELAPSDTYAPFPVKAGR
ncbi:MAG: YihY/virulence factor BrkB family protein [bacterium]|nr:YihY/virulence factor BrkB family protein [bacterium]